MATKILPLALPTEHERLDGIRQLTFFTGPSDRPPLLHQIQEGIDAFVGGEACLRQQSSR